MIEQLQHHSVKLVLNLIHQLIYMMPGREVGGVGVAKLLTLCSLLFRHAHALLTTCLCIPGCIAHKRTFIFFPTHLWILKVKKPVVGPEHHLCHWCHKRNKFWSKWTLLSAHTEEFITSTNYIYHQLWPVTHLECGEFYPWNSFGALKMSNSLLFSKQSCETTML